MTSQVDCGVARSRRARAVGTVGLVLVAAVLVGCDDAAGGGSGGGTPTDERVMSSRCVAATADGNLALAVGARANSPTPVTSDGGRPKLPGAVEALLGRAADRGATLSVVRVDGRPGSVLRDTFTTKGKTDIKKAADKERWLGRTRRAIADVRAKRPEADVLAALALAARQAGPGGTVVLLDSGLQTVDPLDFRQKLLDADPAELVTYLKRKGLLPDLSRRTLVLLGMGDSAAPQQPLDTAQRPKVVEIWTRIGRAAGACVVSSEEVNAAAAVDGVPPVGLVPIERAGTPTLGSCGDTVLRDSGSVGFVRDSDAYRDPAAARASLAGIATQITERKYRVSLIGTTASAGTEQGRLALSKQRAERVRSTLVELGVPASSIVGVHGKGTHWHTHVEDLAPDGRTLLPGPAARNRSVVIRVGC